MCPKRELILDSYSNKNADLDRELLVHATECLDCKECLDSFGQVAKLTETNLLHTVDLDQIEIEVYKRLAIQGDTSADESDTVKGRFRKYEHLDLLIRLKEIVHFSWINLNIYRLLWLTVLTVVLFTAGWKYLVLENDLSSSESISKPRLETFRQEQLRQHIEEANAMQYLKNDSRTSQSILRLVKEQAQGTELESYAGQQIQIAQRQRW
ncbi:hypothetical protein CMK19_11365 [Candidatus Poribacteria bacterium]|nr:hypothetical protein [Candidatus Poribacteria bacterium]